LRETAKPWLRGSVATRQNGGNTLDSLFGSSGGSPERAKRVVYVRLLHASGQWQKRPYTKKIVGKRQFSVCFDDALQHTG